MEKLFSFVKKLPFVGKVLSIIIITLVSIVLIFFSQGCSLKSFYQADNVTHTFESSFKGK